MADRKISDLTALTTPATGDLLPIVDVSEAAAADKNKKITVQELFKGVPDGTAAAPGLAFESDDGNGIYLAGTDTVAISTGGTQRLSVNASGLVTIAGDLQVEGTTTTIESTTLTIDDKNIELGSVDTPSDTTADGGGITLKGATDKTINWVNSTDAWTSSERFDFPAGTAAAPSVILNGDVNSGLYQPGADQVAISTGGSARLYIDSSGRVGIGTTSPNSSVALDVVGQIRSSAAINAGDGASNSASIRFWNANTGLYHPGSDALGFVVGASEKARIDSSGNVGIGASTPTLSAGTGLHLRDDNTGIRLNPSSDGGQGYIEFADEGDTVRYISGYRDANTTYNICPGTSLAADSGFHIDTSGNVGIGASPASIFHVKEGTNKNLRFDGGITEIGSVTGFFALNDAGSALVPFGMRAEDLRFATGSAERVRIDSSGNLGLGTSSPSTFDDAGTGGKNLVIGSTGAGRGVLTFASEQTGGADEPLGIVNFIDSDSTNSSKRGARILGLRGSDANSAYLRFETANSGAPTERVRIESNGRTKFSNSAYGVERTATASAFDLATGNFWTCGAIAIPNPTNQVAGLLGSLRVTAAPTSFAANWKHPAGTYTAPTSFPAVAPFFVQASGTILLGSWTEGIA